MGRNEPPHLSTPVSPRPLRRAPRPGNSPPRGIRPERASEREGCARFETRGRGAELGAGWSSLRDVRAGRLQSAHTASSPWRAPRSPRVPFGGRARAGSLPRPTQPLCRVKKPPKPPRTSSGLGTPLRRARGPDGVVVFELGGSRPGRRGGARRARGRGGVVCGMSRPGSQIRTEARNAATFLCSLRRSSWAFQPRARTCSARTLSTYPSFSWAAPGAVAGPSASSDPRPRESRCVVPSTACLSGRAWPSSWALARASRGPLQAPRVHPPRRAPRSPARASSGAWAPRERGRRPSRAADCSIDVTANSPPPTHRDAAEACAPCVQAGCSYCLSTLQCMAPDADLPCPEAVLAAGDCPSAFNGRRCSCVGAWARERTAGAREAGARAPPPRCPREEAPFRLRMRARSCSVCGGPRRSLLPSDHPSP